MKIIAGETAAYQEIAAAVRSVVGSVNMQQLVGYVPEIRYVDVVYPSQVAEDKLWLRLSLIQAGEKKRTLATPSRKTMQGMVDLQLFVPAKGKSPAELSRKVADLLRGVYAKSTASVDFSTTAIKDMPQDGNWFYKRINATYNYEILE